MMIRTLAWQWEADSVASRAIAPVLAPFITDSTLWAAWQRISDNEVIHAATYSEIVRMSFDNPELVLADILAVKESLVRLTSVKTVFDRLYQASHKYALGQITPDEAYDDLFMGVVALLLLERVQFMASFSITFTICGTNWFQPIGKAVQKIAQDELEVHVDIDKEVIRIELGTKRGQEAYARLKPRIKELCDEIVEAELTWTDYLFSEGRELVGTNAKIVKQWVLFNARDVYDFLDIPTDHKFPKQNPMPHLEDWINIGKSQAAPQEQDNNQYKVGTIVRDDDQKEFDVDF
jgi:ribonucleoside-diphosphate reductase beta chain